MYQRREDVQLVIGSECKALHLAVGFGRAKHQILARISLSSRIISQLCRILMAISKETCGTGTSDGPTSKLTYMTTHQCGSHVVVTTNQYLHNQVWVAIVDIPQLLNCAH